jgi:hypothetical protein
MLVYHRGTVVKQQWATKRLLEGVKGRWAEYARRRVSKKMCGG